MCVQIVASGDAVRGSAVGTATGTRLETDASGNAATFTIGVHWASRETAVSGEYTLYEFGDGTNACHTITVSLDASNRPTFNWRVAGTLLHSVACDVACANAEWDIACSFEKDAGTFGNSTTHMFVAKRGGLVYGDPAGPKAGVTSISVTAATALSYGKHLYASAGSARGIGLLFLRTDSVRDGAGSSAKLSDVSAFNHPLGFLLAAPDKLWMVANHCSQSRPWGGSDNRIGKAVISGTFGLMDWNAASFAKYYGRCALSSTVVGSPARANVMDMAAYTPAMMSRSLVDSAGTIGSTSNTWGYAPSGAVGTKLTALARAFRTGVHVQLLRVAVMANSRGVYCGTTGEVRDKAGTYTGVTTPHNFNDHGQLGAFGLANIAGRGNVAPVSGYDGLRPDQAESSQTALANWGFDAASSYPLTLDNSEAGATMANATYRQCGSGTSMFWTGGRSSANNYQTTRHYGAGGGRAVKAGNSYRVMIKNESTLPLAEALTVKLHVLNFPTSSTIARVRKRAATTQNGSDTLSASDEGSVPTLGAVASKKVITNVSGSWVYDNYDEPTSWVTVRVDDTDNGFANYGVGDLIEMVVDATGAPPNSNSPNLSVIRSISGKGTSTCNIALWRPFETAPVATTHAVIPLDARTMYRSITVTFSANDTASAFRGCDVKASNDGKSGVLILGVDYWNPGRNGVIPVNMGWSGIGFVNQASRLCRIAHWSDGKTPMQRMMEALAPDVLIISHADQGTASGQYVNKYTTLYNAMVAACANTGTEIAFGCGGPEISDPTGDFTGSKNAANEMAAMEQVAKAAGAPIAAWAYDQRYGVHHAARYLDGQEVGESSTHPTGVREVCLWMKQYGDLIGAQPRTQRSGPRRLARLTR